MPLSPGGSTLDTQHSCSGLVQAVAAAAAWRQDDIPKGAWMWLLSCLDERGVGRMTSCLGAETLLITGEEVRCAANPPPPH